MNKINESENVITIDVLLDSIEKNGFAILEKITLEDGFEYVVGWATKYKS